MKFIICAPFHDSDHSNGVLALTHLAISLERQGHEVYSCIMNSHPLEEHPLDINALIKLANDAPESSHGKLLIRVSNAIKLNNLKILRNFDANFIKDFIVIYPEVITENLLGASRIVRYYGNKPGILGKKPPALTDNDFLLSHSKNLIENPHHILFFSYINPVFTDTNTIPAEKRLLDLMYVGKGTLYTKPTHIEDVVEITRQWPTKKSQVASLLKNARFLYTYDSWTNLNLEAVLCGAIPVFLHNGPFTDEEIDGSELGALPRIKLNSEQLLTDEYFKQFEFEKQQLKQRLQTMQSNWEFDVFEFTQKVKHHFQIKT